MASWGGVGWRPVGPCHPAAGARAPVLPPQLLLLRRPRGPLVVPPSLCSCRACLICIRACCSIVIAAAPSSAPFNSTALVGAAGVEVVAPVAGQLGGEASRLTWHWRFGAGCRPLCSG